MYVRPIAAANREPQHGHGSSPQMSKPLSMNGWQEKLVAEILLWICLAASAAAWASYLAVGSQEPVGSDLAQRFAFPIILSSWVAADARARGRTLCYDFDTFVLFAWPIVLPCYLFRTRGPRALLSLLCFAGLCLAGVLFGAMLYGILLLVTR